MDGLRRLLGIIVRSTRRLAVLVVGGGVLAAGLVMMVTPGPGLVVIVAGLAILATEFTWAEILLQRAKKQALRAKNAAVRRGRGFLRRRRTVAVRVTELVEVSDPAAGASSAGGSSGGASAGAGLHGPPVPAGHVELLAVTVTERVEAVEPVD